VTPVPERDADPVSRSGAFEVVRRGYARDQVDALVRELERRAQAAENARRMAEQHAAGLAEELRTLRAGTPAEGLPAVPQSFGFRAEKVLRLAEREADDIRTAASRDAAEIRAAATREAAELMERAHAAAGQAHAEAEADRAAVAAERDDLAAQVAEHVRQAEELAGLRVALRSELARVHAALAVELRVLDGTTAAEPGRVPPVAGPETAVEGVAPPAGVPAEGEADEPPEEPAEVAEEVADEVVPAAGHPGVEQAGDPAQAGDETEQDSPHATGDPAGDPEAPAVWTPTPGTADLFAAEQDRQAGHDRPVQVPEQRREQNTENRHTLRSG
jgi:cell division septum initiation protein DivIVA